jgi:type I restriction enzyme R subunit
MTTDTSERGLERLICTALAGDACEPSREHGVRRPMPGYGGVGWIPGDWHDYDREYCLDHGAALGIPSRDAAGRLRRAGIGAGRADPAQVPGTAPRRDQQARHHRCAAHGIKHGPHHLDLFYGTPSAGNAKAAERYAANRFSVTRQLRYSRDEAQRALDLVLFINGLPVATFELKNSLTKQTVADAVEQYKRDRDPREKLFEFGRCVVHFAVDDHEVRFCTHLKGQGLVVPAVQPGLERRRGQPAQPGRAQDGLPLEAHPRPRGPDGHPRELRADRRDQGREDGQEEGGAGLPALPSARCGAALLADAQRETARASAT